MKPIEQIFTFTTIQTARQRTCCVCGRKTKAGDKVHHVSEIATMTMLCDECFNKRKQK